MGDAPQHGTQYSGGIGDSLAAGDPDGITAARIFSELEKNHITLVFCQLTDLTNTMTAQLKLDAAPFGYDIFLEFSFQGEMTHFLTTTLHKTSARTASHGGHHSKVKPLILTPATWKFDELWGPEEAGTVFSFETYNEGELHPLLDCLADGSSVKVRQVTVRMTKNPVENGEMRFAFYSQIIEAKEWEGLIRNKRAITKVSRFEGITNSKNALYKQANIQAVATFLGREFSIRLRRCGKSEQVFYIPVEVF